MTDIVHIPGINIQWPWSELLLSGRKIVETRSYPLPVKKHGVDLAVIETPGKLGASANITKARITGVIRFSGCFQYHSFEEWRRDYHRHLVEENHPTYGFRTDREKWGWLVEAVSILGQPVSPPKSRGMIFARDCQIPVLALQCLTMRSSYAP